MKNRKSLEKLEQSLTHYLIEETCKADPTKRGTPEMYKYKGLSIDLPDERTRDKVVSIRIGTLEAKFKIENGDKSSGGLSSEDEKMIIMWLARTENVTVFKSIFEKAEKKREIEIIPFDLEEYYE